MTDYGHPITFGLSLYPSVDLVDDNTLPSGPGCVECLATDGWWFYLRRCAATEAYGGAT